MQISELFAVGFCHQHTEFPHSFSLSWETVPILTNPRSTGSSNRGLEKVYLSAQVSFC
jgi:hypothetical protein